MSWSILQSVPNPHIDLNGDPYSGAVLKAYLSGTTTSTSIAIDSSGSSPQTSITYNAEGKLEVSGNEIQPYIDRECKWAIFSNSTDAAANTPAQMGFFDNVPQTPDKADANNRTVNFDVLNDAVVSTDEDKLFDGAVINIKERTTGNGGGAMWDAVLSSTVIEDGIDIIQCTGIGTLSIVLRKPNLLVLEQLGDDVPAITSAIADYKTVKIVDANTLASGVTVTDYCFVEGDAWNNSTITSTLTADEAAFTVGNGFNVSGVLLSSANPLDGIGVSSGDKQVAFNSYSDMNIGGFKYGIWHRKSLWNSYKNINMQGNLCGIRLARADYTAGNSNPVAPSGWNTGWFNNQLTFDNVYVDGSGGGEVGIWACGMGITFNSVTCQDIQTDGTSNQILPGTQVGTGLIIDSGTDTSIDGWNNVVNNYYAENIGIGIHAKGQRYLQINGAFVQGKSGVTQNAVLAERSIVVINGLVGQDSFLGGVVKAIDTSTVYVNDLIGPVVGTKFVADSTSVIFMRGEKDKDLMDYHCNGTGTPGEVFTFPDVVPEKGYVTLRFIGLNDGFDVRVGTAKLYNWNNASASAVVWDNSGTPPAAVVVAVSAGGEITMTFNSSQVLQSRVQIVQEGGFGISTTGKTLTPV